MQPTVLDLAEREHATGGITIVIKGVTQIDFPVLGSLIAYVELYIFHYSDKL
jgi:hypothetical protein